MGDAVRALLDTGSEWCIAPAALALDADYEAEPNPLVPRLYTRFGMLEGRLERITIVFPAEEGLDLDVPATCFFSPDWPGPMVIGWKGCLERMRFALDPGEEAFYFGPL